MPYAAGVMTSLPAATGAPVAVAVRELAAEVAASRPEGVMSALTPLLLLVLAV